MICESLIRRLPDVVFAILFGGGLVLGGDAALAGFPKLLDAVVPGMAAQAGGLAHGVARFAVPPGFMKDGFSQSRFTPQVLYPVTPAPKPDWLVEAMQTGRTGPAPALRGGSGLRARPVIAICIDDLGED